MPTFVHAIDVALSSGAVDMGLCSADKVITNTTARLSFRQQTQRSMQGKCLAYRQSGRQTDGQSVRRTVQQTKRAIQQ
jgi:hypothetical protein